MGLFTTDVSDEVQVTASFLDSNPFGLVVNGEQTGLLLHLNNVSPNNYTLVSAAASYHDPARDWALVKNVTALKYNVPIITGSNLSAPFNVFSEFKPQEIGLTVWVNLRDASNGVHSVTALNQTVSVVEPASTWFDPGLLFLYLILSTALLGGAYAAYQAFFPAPKKRRGPTKSTPSGTKVKAVVPNDKSTKYPDVKPYEEEWIPEQHLKSRASKLKATPGGASSGGEELLSGGEATSGGEQSGAEGKTRRRKSKK